MPHNTDDAPSVVRLRWPDANGATLCGSPYGGEARDSRAAASLGGGGDEEGLRGVSERWLHASAHVVNI